MKNTRFSLKRDISGKMWICCNVANTPTKIVLDEIEKIGPYGKYFVVCTKFTETMFNSEYYSDFCELLFQVIKEEGDPYR